ncbi:MAG: hypothetical protein LBE91_18965 [Tannerella sp.]|jgi:hypothetical protein|nr:hypothetical protein [Tannerella sp.]
MEYILIITIIMTVVIYYTLRYIIEIQKDNEELKFLTLIEKFNSIVNVIDEELFGNNSNIKFIKKNKFYLYNNVYPFIVVFYYDRGCLVITWKHYEKKLILEKWFPNVRNIDKSRERTIADKYLNEILELIIKYEYNTTIVNHYVYKTDNVIKKLQNI